MFTKKCPACAAPISRRYRSDLAQAETCSSRCGGALRKRRRSVKHRLTERTVVDPRTGCHIWQGPLCASVYGRLKVNGKTQLVHRAAWEGVGGPIPAGVFILHSCDTRACCNPNHLRPGTAKDNAADKVVRGRCRGGVRKGSKLATGTPLERLMSGLKRDPVTGCEEWQRGVYGAGYGAMGIDGKTEGCHRISYRLRVGPIPRGAFILHSCDNRLCCAPAHLTLGTARHNAQDMIMKGRGGLQKLRPADVWKIRKLLAAGELNQREIGELFGVKGGAIQQINSGVRWSHLK